MRLVSVAVLAGVVALAGCAHADPARQSGGAGHSAATAAPARRLAALRAGLRDPSGNGPVYYVSLGDSLARGIQPATWGADVVTRRGYTDQLAALLRRSLPGLRLVEFGCPGETTTTMIHGGICRYPAGSQLRQAARFLKLAAVSVITFSLGALIFKRLESRLYNYL